MGRFVGMVVLAAVMLSACSGDEARPDRGRLVVVGGDGSVSVVDGEGGDPETLSESGEPGLAVQATASHDGSTLVWTESEEGPVIAMHEGEDTTRLAAPTAPFFYMFSPDDSRIAALGNDPDGDGVALLMIDPAAASVQLVDVGQPYYVSWNPDSAELVAHIGADLLTRVGVEGTRTPMAASPGRFQAPQWLPDGRVLAVVTSGGITAGAGVAAVLQADGASLAIVDPDDGAVENLAEVTSVVSFQAASDRIAFVDGAAPGGAMFGPLQVVDVRTGELTTVAEDPVVAFEWSRDGEALLFHALDGDDGLVPHVWDGDEVVEHPGFVPTRMFLTQYLPFWSQYVQTVTQWSPDGSAFAYAAATEEGPGEIWIQPLTGERRRVADGEMVVWAP